LVGSASPIAKKIGYHFFLREGVVERTENGKQEFASKHFQIKTKKGSPELCRGDVFLWKEIY